MPPISDNTRLSLRLGVWVAAAIFIVGLTWRVSNAWTNFSTSFDNFKADTSNQFSEIKNTLRGNRDILETQGSLVGVLKTRQDIVIAERWTIQEMKDWAYQLDRENRGNDAGKGISVPNPEQFVQKKVNE